MKLLVLGAAGKSGARLVAAAMQAGHTVTAFARDREKLFSRLAVQPGLIVKIGDVTNETLLSGRWLARTPSSMQPAMHPTGRSS